MRILYITQYYPPEMGAPSARVSELSRHWVTAGHKVTVLTGFPNHPTGVLHPGYRRRFRRLVCREEVDGVEVVRTWLLPTPNRKARERALSALTFLLSSCVTGLFLRRRDVIIATSPQLLVGLTGWWLAKVRRSRFVFEVRDLWPESIAATGSLRSGSLLVRGLRRLARFLYRSCDHVAVVTPAFKEELVARYGVPEQKISVVENGVEADLFSPEGTRFDLEGPVVRVSVVGPHAEFVVSYIGTLGVAHRLETVLEAAGRLQQVLPEALFLLVGEGAEKERLVSMARDQKLANVRFLPGQPRSEVPALIRASDVCLVPLRSADVFRTVIPTKMLEFMACGRPVILGVEGQARQVLEEAGAGLAVPPDDSSALADAIRRLHGNSGLREEFGRNGRRYVVQRLSRAETARRYLSLLDDVVTAGRRRKVATKEGGR